MARPYEKRYDRPSKKNFSKPKKSKGDSYLTTQAPQQLRPGTSASKKAKSNRVASKTPVVPYSPPRATPKAPKARRSPLATPEVQSAVERLRSRYTDSGRTVEEARRQTEANVRQRESRVDDIAAAQVQPDPAMSRTDFIGQQNQARQNTALSSDGKTVKRFRGKRIVGTPSTKSVARAAQEGSLRGKNRLTTPEVRQTKRQVKRARRQVRRARAQMRTGIEGPLTPGQKKFAEELAKRTAINPRVAGAWVLAEMSGGAAQGRESESNHNWLNINYNDSGPGAITRDPVWRNPVTAAKATAQFLRGQKWSAGANIPSILPRSRGASDETQIQAIAESGWASSGYEGGNALRGTRDLIGFTPPEPGARRRLERAKDNAEEAAKKAAELGIRAAGLVTPRVANELGLRPLDQNNNAPKKAVQSFRGMIAAAKQLEAWQLPYVWGGGHGTTRVGDPRDYGGLDCSSAVSHILQQGGVDMPTTVSGGFGSYTKPGPGAVTILYNDGHVLMKIGDKYFGTSGTNPGGGPGWIDKSVGDSEMASGEYNIGHVPGLGPKVAKQMNLDPDSYRVFPGMTVNGNTATVNGGGVVSYTPTFSDRPIVAGEGPAGQNRRRNNIFDRLESLGYRVNSKGVFKIGEGRQTKTEYQEAKERFGIK